MSEDDGDVATQEVWLYPREYELGAAQWQDQAIDDLSRAIHPILDAIGRETVRDLPEPTQEPSTDLSRRSTLYRSVHVRHHWVWSAQDVVDFDVDSYLQHLYETADSIGGQMAAGMFEHIRAVAEEHGQNVQMDGRNLYDFLIEQAENSEPDFDENGNPVPKILAGNPETLQQLMGDGPTPEQEEKMRIIIERKREEWLASRRRRELP